MLGIHGDFVAEYMIVMDIGAQAGGTQRFIMLRGGGGELSGR